MPANSTTVELDRPLNTCFVGIKPMTPHAMAPAVAVIARGMISEIKRMATINSRIKHCTSFPILISSFVVGCLTVQPVRQTLPSGQCNAETCSATLGYYFPIPHKISRWHEDYDFLH